MKRLLTVIVVLILSLLSCQQVFACTIFNMEKNGEVLVGNNEDFFYTYSSELWIAASGEDSYGRICFANSSYVQGGMNEKGLFYDGAMCPASKIPYDESKPQLNMDMGEIILSKCGTVDEVIKFVEGYNIPQSYTDHLMFADSSGACAVIEWMDDDMKIVKKEGSYQIATNFWLSDPKLGGYPCSRYEKAEEMLSGDRKDISAGFFADILKATAQDWGDGGTKYSNVYDLKRQEVVIYTKGDFNQYIKLNLQNELENLSGGEKTTYDIDQLFENEKLVQKTKLINDSIIKPDNTDSSSLLSKRTGDVRQEERKAENETEEAEGSKDKGINWTIIWNTVIVLLILAILFYSLRRRADKKEE